MADTSDESIQERLQLAVTGTGAGVWEWDMETNRVVWSEEMERLAWLGPGEFEGTLQAFRALVHPDDAQGLQADMRRCAEDPAINVFSNDLRLVNAHGESRWISSTGQVFRHPDGRAHRMLGLATDSSAKRSLEEQLRQAQKLEAIGGLAAGIAHDFNNVLSVVLSYADLALLDLEPEATGRTEMQEIREAGRRARDLTRHLLAFSRQQVLQPRILNLNDTLLGLEKLLRRLLAEDVHMTLITTPDLGRVNADPTQIEQVIVNLVVNARDAMPTGGHLSIQTANVVFDITRAAEHVDLTPGRYVRLSVSDTGAGMPAAVRARIFEPFFTTKEHGKGTGLGLATVLGIVKQSGGHISVESEIGRGTRFDAYFPLLEQPADPILAPSLQPKPLNGTETILLVEDDDQVRNLVRTILRRGGYEVLEARNAGEALLLCERHASRLDLVLTDVIMPLMSGRELAERLSTLVPRLKVLFMSGYTDDAVLRHGIAKVPAVSLVQKPITPNELLTKVRELLDAELG